eukprot:scaffold439_cov415-Prasinococcus_capsulatus_cf.AAC.20
MGRCPPRHGILIGRPAQRAAAITPTGGGGGHLTKVLFRSTEEYMWGAATPATPADNTCARARPGRLGSGRPPRM